MTKSADLLQGTLDLLILKVLSLQPMHGWAIAQRIRQLSRLQEIAWQPHRTISIQQLREDSAESAPPWVGAPQVCVAKPD